MSKNINSLSYSRLYWYVLLVKPRQDFKVENFINKSGLPCEAFCPYRMETKIWSDRKKKVKVPLLGSIVLIKSSEINRNLVFNFPGAVRYLQWLGKPDIVKEDEVKELRYFTTVKNIVSNQMEPLKPGNTLELDNYGFTNTKGVIKKVSNNICWVVLETLGFTLKVTTKEQ